jgi:cbb3-type cytochrome oxidase subunit 3
LVSGMAMGMAPHGLPMALAAMAGLFVCAAWPAYRRAERRSNLASGAGEGSDA